ncbi:MAG TPA: sodium:alanine symporter family protein [Nitrospinota bacterium]|jgi:AGCS family alanine or glycine:cation symporter|nr:sodium:alanine symporter family protein [Nitrospinota bacterium]
MTTILDPISSFVWGPVTIILIVGTGIYTTILVKAVQIRRFNYAWKLISGKFDKKNADGEITHFQALSTALSATIGTGNIAGVGTAIAMGGPGAVFWMWITALFGMGLKYAECLLSLKYRVIHDDGSAGGGPMYYLEKGLGQKWLGILFAVFASIASFGIGNMVQANSVAAPLYTQFGIPKIVTGLIIGGLVFMVIVGGIKRVGKVASKLVPFMSVFYVVGALTIIITKIDAIPEAFGIILSSAFTPASASGGFAGAAVAQVIRYGVARGVFSNEAGLGSAPIAHGAARTNEPVREGLVAMLGPFIDTIVICSMTALVIILTGAYTIVGANGSGLTGADLTAMAFSLGLNTYGKYIVSFGLIFFAFSTAISWSYYGDRCVDYLFGQKLVKPYRIIYCILLPVGAYIELEIVWTVSDIFNALMAWPNLVGLLFLSPVVIKTTKEYFSDPAKVNPPEQLS